MRLSSILGLACCVGLTALASAQTRPPTTQPQSPTTPSQPIKPMPTAPSYPTPLYRMNDIGTALKLERDQITRLDAVTNKLQKQYEPQYGKIGSLSAAERYNRLQELNRLYLNEWNKNAADILNEQQRQRYQQLTLQYGGFNSLYDPNIQKQLSLTPEQIKSLRENVDWSTQQLNTIRNLGTSNVDRAEMQYRNYWKQYNERFNKFLTPEQQKTWRTLTGEPYTFRPDFIPR